MIEMLGVLAIIGVLSAGGIMGYSMAMENYKVNKLIEEIQTANANILQTFSRTDKIGSDLVSMGSLIKVGVLPQYYKDKLSGNCTENIPNGGFSCWIPSPFNKQQKMYAYMFGKQRFTIQIELAPKKLCIKFYTHDWGTYTGKTTTWRNNSGLPNQAIRTQPISVAEAETLCSESETKGSTAISFFIK